LVFSKAESDALSSYRLMPPLQGLGSKFASLPTASWIIHDLRM